jgi:REP-associated tyrosine transposase
MPQSLACLQVHFVFSTKNRLPVITPELAPRLYSYIGGIVRDAKCVLLCAGGMPDHVHLLISMSREMSASEMMRLVKANSSKWVHETFAEINSFAWQTGYGAFSVSFSMTDVVKGYIARQEEHHGNQSFQDEYRALLRKHEVPFDERYVWD